MARYELYEYDRVVLQNDLHRLSNWADIWQMEFNVSKCKVMHFGAHNKQRSMEYTDRLGWRFGVAVASFVA